MYLWCNEQEYRRINNNGLGTNKLEAYDCILADCLNKVAY